jgi:site-specific recombinase XerD
MKFSEAIHRFSTWRTFKVKVGTVKGYDKELRIFCLFLRNPHIEEIQLNDVMDYLTGLRELGWNHNSFVPKCMALRKFFEFCRRQGHGVLNEDLIPIPRKEYRIPRVVTVEVYRQLLAAIPVNNDPRHIRNRAIIDLLWDTGARNGEIVALDLNDIDLSRTRALIRTEKSRGRRPLRELFWTHGTNESLGNWLQKRSRMPQKDPDAVFVSTCSTNVGQRFTIKGVGEMLRRYCNRARIPCVNPHSFRHHMGHDIIHKGGSAADVMNILGHSTLASSTIYTMMTDKELEERYRKFKGQ